MLIWIENLSHNNSFKTAKNLESVKPLIIIGDDCVGRPEDDVTKTVKHVKK